VLVKKRQDFFYSFVSLNHLNFSKLIEELLSMSAGIQAQRACNCIIKTASQKEVDSEIPIHSLSLNNPTPNP
jgi:hypothetical protein